MENKSVKLIAGMIICIISFSGCASLSGLKFYSQELMMTLDSLDPEITQAVAVKSLKKNIHEAQLSAWQRKDGRWQRKFYPIPAVIGRSGFARMGAKQEGDGHTPSGIYPLKQAFGYDPKINTGLLYRQVTENDFWVDDPASIQYNQWVTGVLSANSFEHLKRSDSLYRYGIVVEYNTDPVVTFAGSAIFVHIWRGAHHPTAGCVAVSEENIKRLLAWLKSSHHPVIVLN